MAIPPQLLAAIAAKRKSAGGNDGDAEDKSDNGSDDAFEYKNGNVKPGMEKKAAAARKKNVKTGPDDKASAIARRMGNGG